MAEHQRSFGTHAEYKFRRELFARTYKTLEEMNARNGLTFTVGINKFADWTEVEKEGIMGFKPDENREFRYEDDADEATY